MTTNPNWHVVYTKPNCERKVLQLLAQKGIDSYCPFHMTTVKWRNRESIIRKPLFSTYVFVHATETQLAEIKKIKPVVSILYRMNAPAIIQQEDIQAIRHVMYTYKKIELIKTGFPVVEQPIEKDNDTMLYPIRSLGFTLKAVGIAEEVRTLKPVWSDQQGAKATKQLQALKNFHGMLMKLPSMIRSKAISVEETLTRKLEQQ